MCLTANFGAVTHYAKSFATPWLKLLDIFSFLRILQDFFLTRSICSIFFGGICTAPPSKIKWSTPNFQAGYDTNLSSQSANKQRNFEVNQNFKMLVA